MWLSRRAARVFYTSTEALLLTSTTMLTSALLLTLTSTKPIPPTDGGHIETRSGSLFSVINVLGFYMNKGLQLLATLPRLGN